MLRLTLPSSLVEEAERKADALGVSLTAYVSAALAIAVDHRDEIPLRIRLLERVHRIKFRCSQGSASPNIPAPAPIDQEAL